MQSRYMKITGHFTNYQNGQRVPTGVGYCIQQQDLLNKRILIQAYNQGQINEVQFQLEDPELLRFKTVSTDPNQSSMTGKFLNSKYLEYVTQAVIPDQEILIQSAFTLINENLGLGQKLLIDTKSSQIMAVIEEQVEFLSKEDFHQQVVS